MLAKIKSAFLIAVTIATTVASFSFAPLQSLADSAQDQINADNQQIALLNQQIAQYTAELNTLGANKKTLQAAIKSLDLQRSKVQAQVAITQKQINTTQVQIQQLSDQIATTNKDIATNQSELAEYLRQIQESDTQPVILAVLSAGSFSEFWQNLDTTVQLQNAVSQKVQALQTEQVALTNNKAAVLQKQDTLSAQKKSLASQQQTLNLTEQSKNQLLAQTNAQESQYQKLLAQAKAQLDSFSKFTQNAGGTNLLANQTVCDDWGCYYNQRDTLWGGAALNGTQYSLASDGCLITAMAMVLTHYGYRDVTPATINAESANFASYYPAYLLYTIVADGITATRKTSAIDATLATGNPVVIGMNVYGGTHFVVLVSGSNGKYIMRDPYLANAKDINFTDHYTMKEIYSIAKVVIGG